MVGADRNAGCFAASTVQGSCRYALPIAERRHCTTDHDLAEFAANVDAPGYLADFDKLDDDNYRINLHSCPMWAVANRYRQACAAELDFLRDLIPDATVQRVTHETNGPTPAPTKSALAAEEQPARVRQHWNSIRRSASRWWASGSWTNPGRPGWDCASSGVDVDEPGVMTC